MKLFEYENFNLVINLPEVLLIKEFKDVWESDKSPNKEYAMKIFTFGYLYCDFQSPFSEFEEADKKQESLKSAGLTEDDINTDCVKAFIEMYLKIVNSNRIIRYIKSTWALLDKLEKYALEVDLTKTITSGSHKGRLLHSVRDARDTVKQMPELIIKAKELRELLKEEMKKSDAVRGDLSKGYFN